MTSLQRLTIGYIPENCNSEWIAPGDPENSETVETYIERKDKKFFLDAIKIIKEDQLDQYYDGVKSSLVMSELANDEEINKIIKKFK